MGMEADRRESARPCDVSAFDRFVQAARGEPAFGVGHQGGAFRADNGKCLLQSVETFGQWIVGHLPISRTLTRTRSGSEHKGCRFCR